MNLLEPETNIVDNAYCIIIIYIDMEYDNDNNMCGKAYIIITIHTQNIYIIINLFVYINILL